MRIILYPYKMKSKSAMRLQKYLLDEGVSCLRVYPDGEYTPRRDDLIVGWGAGNTPAWARSVRGTYLNKSGAVSAAVDKLLSFQKFARNEVSCVPFSVNKRDAVEWIKAGAKVVLRKTTEGRDGEGIDLVDNMYDFWDKEAPLYTKFISDTTEYRVHIFRGNVIDVQEKRPREGSRQINPLLRTTSGGWGLYRGNVRCPQVCQNSAITAVRALGLDFGAVDVLSARAGNAAHVLEVNTAPELTEICTEKYGDILINYARAL